MKLTKEQTQEVENYLDEKKIDYIDLQTEVLDHLITDIETTMETSKIDFETSFKETKEKWSDNLSPTFSFLLGPIYFRPSIFLERCKKIYIPHLDFATPLMFLYLIVFFILKHFILKNSEEVIKSLNYFIVFTSFVYTCFICYWYFMIKKTKQKTTFSFLFNTQVAPTILVLILVVANIINESFLEFGSFYTIFLFMLLMTFYRGYSFYKNHIITIEKYKMA